MWECIKVLGAVFLMVLLIMIPCLILTAVVLEILIFFYTWPIFIIPAILIWIGYEIAKHK